MTHSESLKRVVVKRLALNPLLKEMQIKGMTEHCMDDHTPDPLYESSLSLTGLGVVRYDDESRPQGYWTIGDILKLWEAA